MYSSSSFSLSLSSQAKPAFSSNFIPIHPFLLLLIPSKLKLKTKAISFHKSSSSSSPSSVTKTIVKILRAIPDWADHVKERGVQQNRTLYDHQNWVEHRSSLRHVRHFLSSLSSRVVLSLIPPVIVFTTFAAIIAGYNSAVLAQWLPEFFPVLRASSLSYQLTAPALALLLVFRTEEAYARFVEGKKAWTKVISGVHDFARLLMVDNSGDDMHVTMALLHYIMAFPVALKCHVLCGSDLRRDLQNLLEVDDLEVVVDSKNPPRCIIEFISQSIRLLKLEDSRKNALESKIICFHEGIAICEQILSIPIPLSYTYLTSRFLVLWHLTLPIILWDDCHWIVVPATFISAASLFCIEEVGVLIEEPFPMLALDDLCKKAYKDIQEALATQNIIRSQLIAKRNSNSKDHSQNGSNLCI